MHHLTYTERLFIEKHYNSGMSCSAISRLLCRNRSTISREIKRGLYDKLDSNTYSYIRCYSADVADADAQFKASAKGSSIKLGHNYDYAQSVSEQIHNGLSPDVIVGVFRARGLWTVSTSTLYRYIDNGYIPNVSNSDLLVKSKKKRRAYRKVRPSRCPSGHSIEFRPDIFDRSEFGHWELDSIVGKSSGQHESVLSLLERKTRVLILVSTLSKTAESTVSALKFVRLKYGDIFKTVTCDNGSEFADSNGIESALSTSLYYCHPYSSSERGSNENINRLVRRYFPKGHSLSKVSQSDCDFVSDRINSLPRKILGYQTAHEIFLNELSLLG